MKPIWKARDKRRWLKRALNRARLQLSYQLGWQRVPGLPHILMIEPTNECNLHCPLCPTGAGTLRRPKGTMTFELYERILAELDGTLERLMLYNYGEPFLHPRIFDMIALARRAEVHTRISTNGLVFLRAGHADDLIASGLNHLRVSLDGATQETYTKYRVGGQLAPILEGVRLLQQRKRELGRARPPVELQFIAMGHNEHELPAVRQLAQEMGTPLRVKTVGLGDISQGSGRQEWLPRDASLRRYRENEGRLELADDGRVRFVCDQPWNRLVVNWDGQVAPCCYDRHGDYGFGNANDGLATVWNGERLRAFRRAVRSPSPPAICQRCAARLWNSPKMGWVERLPGSVQR
ncbi:MAG: SPASM domain-containing protein [Anaerolineae bacterium]|nr:SPASM domain-containing protein [Anaerolineae bacterium]